MSVKFSLKINFRKAFGEEKYYSVAKSKSWHSDYISLVGNKNKLYLKRVRLFILFARWEDCMKFDGRKFTIPWSETF